VQIELEQWLDSQKCEDAAADTFKTLKKMIMDNGYWLLVRYLRYWSAERSDGLL
jgi:hypothetical protein